MFRELIHRYRNDQLGSVVTGNANWFVIAHHAAGVAFILVSSARRVGSHWGEAECLTLYVRCEECCSTCCQTRTTAFCCSSAHRLRRWSSDSLFLSLSVSIARSGDEGDEESTLRGQEGGSAEDGGSQRPDPVQNASARWRQGRPGEHV